MARRRPRRLGCFSCCARCCANWWRGCYVPTCDFHGCCLFPHGTCYTILGQVFGLGGIIMNMYVMMSCFFQRVVMINPITGEPIQGSERGYGFLSRESDYGITPDYRKCFFYPPEEEELLFDGWMKSGKAFAFMSGILGFICFCVLLLASCVAFSPSMWERWLLWLYLFAAVFIGLSFLAFGSEFCTENDCKIAQGGGWAISTFLFWIICANIVKSMPHPLPLDDWEGDSDDEDDWDDGPAARYVDKPMNTPPPAEGPQYMPNDVDQYQETAAQYPDNDYGDQYQDPNEENYYPQEGDYEQEENAADVITNEFEDNSDHLIT